MSLDKKIDQIRKKPEHVRKRYVLASVIFCMIFVLMIWYFSIKTNFSNTGNEQIQVFDELQEQFNETGEPLQEMPSIEDFVTEEDPFTAENTPEIQPPQTETFHNDPSQDQE